MQDTPDGVGADRWQAIRRMTERSLQCGERPGGGAVVIPIRCPACFLENPLLVTLHVVFGLAAAMPLDQCVDPISVEPRDQVGDSIATLPTGSTGSPLEAGTIRHREHLLGSRHLGCGLRTRAADVLQIPAFVGCEGTQGIFLMSGHDTLRGRRDGEYLPPPYAHYPAIGNHQDK